MATIFLVPKNDAVTALDADITAGATTLTVLSGDGSLFPSTFPFHVSIEEEIMEVGARSGDVLSTLTRGSESTSAAAHIRTAVVDLLITAQAVSDLNAAVNEVERRVRSVTDISFGDSSLGESYAP